MLARQLQAEVVVMQLDLFSCPSPVEVVPVEAPKLPTAQELHLQAKADSYLTQMNRLADLMFSDLQPHLKPVRAQEMTRLAELRNAALTQIKQYAGAT
jgi:hypothetical protein